MKAVRTEFIGHENNRLVAEIWGNSDRPVLFFHGGGQTRHAWDNTARRLAECGMTAITVDLRGHGESEWVSSGNYAFDNFCEDVVAITRSVRKMYQTDPSAVGASLGGLSSLAAEARFGPLLNALTLVDITPRMDPDGVAKIQGFMGERMEEGFASLDEAAAAIAKYLPNRRRPTSHDGLRKNLRLGPDGRYRWHWDPAFITSKTGINSGTAAFMDDLMSRVPGMHVPILLTRGMQSELVHDHHAREFVSLAPNASYIDIGGAGHMVAGDKNDIFCDAILEFLTGTKAA